MPKILFIPLYLLVSAYSFAQSTESMDIEKKAIPSPDIVFVSEYTFLAKDVESYCSLRPTQNGIEPTILIPKYELVVPTKILMCPLGEKIVEVFVGGNKYILRREHVNLEQENIDRIRSISQENRDDYESAAKLTSIQIRKMSLEDALKELEKTKKFGITIFNASIADVSEYTEGTSFRIEVSNPTTKTIKYLWFTVVGYNAVNDPVRDRLKGGPSLTVKGIGPIKQNESGRYEWEYMWHTDIVESFKISEIRIQYMDGTIRSVKNQKAVTLSKKSLQALSAKY